MTNPQNEKATGQGGFSKVVGGQAEATKQKRPRNCSAHHNNKVAKELRRVDLQLKSTAGDTQLATLPKVLQYLGPRGLNTYEGVAAGYLRIATRIKELKDTWEIITVLEDVIGPDGLFHKGVARYVLIGKKKHPEPVQSELGLEGDQ
jgi:hypothetical protein